MKSGRNASVELLRITAMFMIVMLHLLCKTSAIDEVGVGSSMYLPVWILESVCRTGNSIFILISGYFYQSFSFKTEKLLKLWVQVFFYSVSLAIVSRYVLGYTVLSDWNEVLFPIVKREYWFISVYIALYCLAPSLKKIIENMSDILMYRLLLLGGLFFSILPTVFVVDVLYVGGAYGIAWFVYLFLLGAYIKNGGEQFLKRTGGIKIISLLLLLLLPIGKYIVEWLSSISMGYPLAGMCVEALYGAHSPIMLLGAVGIFICFLRINIKSDSKWAKVINFLGKGCIGVYLIHNNQNMARYIWTYLRINYWLVEKKNLIVIFLIAIGVFVICNLLDHAREYIFDKIYINKLIEKAAGFITNSYLKLEGLAVGKK